MSPEGRVSADSAVARAARCSAGVPHNAKTGDAAPAPVLPVFRTGSEPLLSPRLRPARPTHLGSVTHMHTYSKAAFIEVPFENGGCALQRVQTLHWDTAHVMDLMQRVERHLRLTLLTPHCTQVVALVFKARTGSFTAGRRPNLSGSPPSSRISPRRRPPTETATPRLCTMSWSYR